MKKSLSLLLLSLLCLVAQAQSPVVPNNIYFADIHLQIQESARTEIQKVVDALTKHPGYFQKKVELADAYFPFVEQTLKQEGVPADFKYLVLQESGLVSDAVSTSNAVGFWQFKEASATELGVRVNSQVDERKHIIESSRGAAKYMLRSNAYYKNWFNTLLSYYQGLNGTKALTKTSDIGAKKMEVTNQTNKYLLTFLAHKVAYENAIGKNPNPTITLQPVKAVPGQTLTEIAMAAQADAAEVERYNKWLMASTVPSDKEYTVMIPYVSGASRPVLASAGPVRKSGATTPTRAIANRSQTNASGLKGFIQTIKAKLNNTYVPASIVAQPGDNKDMLALQGNISTSKFLRVNDMKIGDEVVPGKTYYLQGKRAKAKDTEFHVAQRGETMQDISQKYAMKLNKLYSKNRMQKSETLEPGRVMWLQETRPTSIPVEIRPLEDEAPAATEVLAQAPATQPAAATPVASTPKPTTQPTPKPGAISVEVEDTSVPPYVKKTPQEEAASAPATYPTKNPAAVATNKPAPALERKAPEEAVISDVKVAAPQPIAIPASGTHVVEKGETFYSISRKYGIPVGNLLAWNQMDGSVPLALGKELVLTGSATTSTASSTPATAPAATSAPVTAAAPVKATPAAAPAATSATEHTVAPSETLYAISRKYGISVQDLQTWNNLGTGAISIGQKLVVSAPAAATTVSTEAAPDSSSATPATDAITHKVAPGESMYGISRKYGVTIQQLQEWNNKTDYNVSVGESLVIKPKQ
ncbi:LysM peptidoglycan-binding domain-containing protein [Rufibacter sediminis]|uniref:LysM peptidoglycan-binding domain-containing protein n=1 Tax=Rufibacter sediminis TaxID=2762756 RepID=A0ABR6VRY1_9BACT|nr:LysM peptidoglycan-binding domain-containing protein [Rufibacter sediminis]MBC3539953.1 LysM peptidoglycan-binding domain-containing protein [Rufibacter sediminis]